MKALWAKVKKGIQLFFRGMTCIGLSARMSHLEQNLKALQAIDAGWKERGKIVIVAHVGDRDIIKIIDTKAELTLMEYKAMSERLEAEYGARATFFDTEHGGRAMAKDIFGGRSKRL